MSKTKRLDAMVDNLLKRGVPMPRNQNRARLEAASMHKMAREGVKKRAEDFGIVTPGSSIQSIQEENQALVRVMGNNRALRRQSSNLGGDTFAAIPRFYDPLEFWDLSGLPWNIADEGHRHKIHKWLRLYYSTHYLIPILIDIFTRFPLVGLELSCKDPHLQGFYEDLFLDQLDYPDFLVKLGREYWLVGECFSLGSFNEDHGIWEREELLNPEDMVVENFPLLGSKQLKIKPPEYLTKLVQTGSPAKELKQLEINFPEIIPYLRKAEHIPISSVLLKHVANTLTTWDDHGTPILLRGLRTIIHEEKLLASQDAIAERLYSPLILAQLGLEDLGDGQGPWIPGPEEIESVRDEMDIALSSDFRLIVHHMGLKMENVFGREQMPRLGDDFDRVEKRIMQVFGVNPSLLSAGSTSQPYASSALQAEFMNQILRTFQNHLKRHFRDRAMVVAEAQGHYEYEKKGQTRVPIYEEVIVVDQETGEKKKEKKHKLLIPDMNYDVLDVRDEATERQFLQSMRAQGVPIPDSKLMVGVEMTVPEMVDKYNEELMEKTIAQQEAKMKTYKALDAKNLPIPSDLKAEVESVLNPGQAPASPGGLPSMPGGMGPGSMKGPLGGPAEGIIMPPTPNGLMGGRLGPTGLGTGAPGTPGSAPPISPNDPSIGNGFAPPASFERRPGMPRPLSVKKYSNIEIRSMPPQGDGDKWLAAFFDGDYAGHIGYTPDEDGSVYVDNLEVPEYYQRKGIGTQLVQAMQSDTGVGSEAITGDFDNPQWPDGKKFWDSYFKKNGKNRYQSDTVQSTLRKREEQDDSVLYTLPTPKYKKSYSLIGDEETAKEIDESTESESTGSLQGGDPEMGNRREE